MSTTVQIRSVPETLHRRLKARAAMEGLSMSAYVRRLIERNLEYPSQKEVIAALRALPPVETDRSAAEILQEAREARGSW